MVSGDGGDDGVRVRQRVSFLLGIKYEIVLYVCTFIISLEVKNFFPYEVTNILANKVNDTTQ